MRILIVSNSPNEVGGVANYTRPLAMEFASMGHQVHYFYSGAFFRRYDWRIRPYLRGEEGSFPFECVCLVNSPCKTNNYGMPELDLRETCTERLFERYLGKVRPDIVHFHSRMGLPVSLVTLASRSGARVYNTVHVYGTLCQKRTMIDLYGNPCNGPSEFLRCAECTSSLPTPYSVVKERIKNSNPKAAKALSVCKRILSSLGATTRTRTADRVRSSKADILRLKERLAHRLEKIIEIMNEDVVLNLCVSSDVLRRMERYGVRIEKLALLPIGSQIASVEFPRKPAATAPVVIGNIGGVNHYKGTHVLLDAIELLGKRNDYEVRIYGKQDKDYLDTALKGKRLDRVRFMGSYEPSDLPSILTQIDVMVLPSICHDTAPQTIFESNSAKIPIIASDIGGFPDFIKDTVNGLLFRPGDSADLSGKIAGVLDDPRILAVFSENIQCVKTIQENAREMLSLYVANR